MRWDVQIPEETAKVFANKQPVLFAMWHGRLLFASPVWKRFVHHTPAAILVSQHTDGDFTKTLLAHYDVQQLRGSSSKGALAGAIAVLQSLKSGCSTCLTIDGPRGPRMRLSSGISRLATKSNCAIVSFSFSAQWGINLGSWDSMLIPFPFSKGVVSLSNPVHVITDRESEADVELEKNMILQQNACDQLVGRAVVTPGERRHKNKKGI